MEAQRQEAQAQISPDGADLIEVIGGLGADGVRVGQRCARQFELTARLQAHGCAVTRQGDHLAALLDRFPAEAVLQPGHQGQDAVVAVVGNGGVVAEIEAELLVLGADAPIAGRL